jgi:hypothetical protein
VYPVDPNSARNELHQFSEPASHSGQVVSSPRPAVLGTESPNCPSCGQRLVALPCVCPECGTSWTRHSLRDCYSVRAVNRINLAFHASAAAAILTLLNFVVLGAAASPRGFASNWVEQLAVYASGTITVSCFLLAIWAWRVSRGALSFAVLLGTLLPAAILVLALLT